MHGARSFPIQFIRALSYVDSCNKDINILLISVGDYSAQAVINAVLGRTFPDDPIVGEEDANDLRQVSASSLRTRIVELANGALAAPLTQGEKAEWGIGPGISRTEDELLAAIDKGSYQGGPNGRMFDHCSSIFIFTRDVLIYFFISRILDT